ncbi:hypothetical protein A3C26_00205 [Candidatus Daviesbacteria bacterium RIFCSPHIGHO2_02_FULL_39_12]|uniref:Uncharacterized protein n=1 Tax=Candidatus Daviesbacteria bacterium RIFCSPHIGHO2_02_FULL_39_12 TaxID=1797770 RepID=A0A1F5J8E2_9BACT|nr:MAG: hypothetical protein A3C26_00205 [Candidatus Daviesbacteria bacterium RIFCSPHIGHO2_02_FULL_39_12]
MLDPVKNAKTVGFLLIIVGAIYGIGLLGLLGLFFAIFFASQGEQISTGSVISLVITALLFFWFYSARNKFT